MCRPNFTTVVEEPAFWTVGSAAERTGRYEIRRRYELPVPA
jgi:hypothetical protein